MKVVLRRDPRGRFAARRWYCAQCRTETPHHRCRSGACLHCSVCHEIAAAAVGIMAGLRAELGASGWRVRDLVGGVWYPDDAATAEILGACNPAVAAVEICARAPMRGQWHD